MIRLRFFTVSLIAGMLTAVCGTLSAAIPAVQSRSQTRGSAPEIPAYLLNRGRGAEPAAACPSGLDACVTGINKELPRGEWIPYASAEKALEQRYEDAEYLQVLDGTWSSAPFDEGGLRGTSFSCTFKHPFAWIDRQVFLHVGGATSSYDVRVNGKPAGYSQDGRTGAEFDLTRYVAEGNNTLEVVVYANGAARCLENHAPEGEQPAIAGRTFLIAQPKVRVRDFVADTRMEGTNGLLSLGVVMKSHLLNFKEYEIFYDLLSPEGNVVAGGHREARFDMRLEDTVRFFANIPDVRPWNDETPNLYTLRVRTKYEGRFAEYYAWPVGFRQIAVEYGRVSLNGLPISFRAVPYTVPAQDEAMRSELAALKQRGVNTVCITGCPAREALFRACDELGLYVCNQANIDTQRAGNSPRKGGNPSNDPRFRNAYVERAEAMYHGSKAHPSAVLFSIAGPAANGFNLYESYLALKRAEPQRPVVYLYADGQWNSDAVPQDDGSGRVVLAVRDAGQIAPTARVELSKAEGAGAVFTVANRFDHTPLRNGVVDYVIRTGGRQIGTGRVAVQAEPGQEVQITILPPPKTRPGTKAEITLTVSHEEPAGFRFTPGTSASGSEPKGIRAVLSGGSSRPEPAHLKRVELNRQTFSVTL